MKLKGLLKVALVLLAVSSLFVACDTIAGGKWPVIYTKEAGKVYMQPCADWQKGDERYVAYFWKNTADNITWVDMVAKDDPYTENLYEATVPTDVEKVIFIRMNGSTTENNWSNKWDQTDDLKIPTGDDVLYCINSSKNGKAEGYWLASGGEKQETPSTDDDKTDDDKTDDDKTDDDGTDDDKTDVLVTPESSTSVYSYTLPISQISSAWGGSSEKASFNIMLMTDAEVEAKEHKDEFKVQSGNIDIYTHESGNFSIKSLNGVAATITESELTVFVDMSKMSTAEGKKPYVVALASKENDPDKFTFSGWGETMIMDPDATYPTGLKENAAPQGTLTGCLAATHIAGTINGWSHAPLDENKSYVFTATGTEAEFKFTPGAWGGDFGGPEVSLGNKGDTNKDWGTNAKVTGLTVGNSYKITLTATSADSASFIVTEVL